MRRLKPEPVANSTEPVDPKKNSSKKKKDDDNNEEEEKDESEAKKKKKGVDEDEEIEDDDDDDDDEEDGGSVSKEYEYYGFLIDLLEEIKQEIEKSGQKFPEYTIVEVKEANHLNSMVEIVWINRKQNSLEL
jgi:hypothetical protein